MGFQENLRYYRERAGYKQSKDFAQALDIPYSTYKGYETQGREPKYNTLCKIADLLNVSTDELLGRENNILGMNEDERLRNELDEIFSNFNNPAIKIDSIDKKVVNFYLGTQIFKFGKIEVDKSYILNCLKHAKEYSISLKNIEAFNILTEKILDTAFKELENDIKGNEKVIKEILELPKEDDETKELEKEKTIEKIKKTNISLQNLENFILKQQKIFREKKEIIMITKNTNTIEELDRLELMIKDLKQQQEDK